MSKLTNLIEAHQTGRVRLTPTSPVAQVMEDSTRVLDPLKCGMLEYRLEEVFGEFRPMLRRVERAIYELDWEEARDALRDLEMEMRY